MDFDPEIVHTIITTEAKVEMYRKLGRKDVEVFPNCAVHADYEANRRRYPDMKHRGMRELFGTAKGETILICGSGPSLKECPVKPGVKTFAINRAITRVQADYFAFVDLEAWRLYSEHENAKKATKMFGANMYILLPDVENVCQVDFLGSPNSIKNEARRPLYFNCNTFAWVMHLAIKMGAKRIVTIGCEFSGTPQFDGFVAHGYEGPGVQAKLMNIARNRMLEMFGADKDQWFDPNVEILDASNGALPVPKVNLKDVL